MPFLIALVVLVGVLCAVDLVLSVGIIRRLREHSEALSALGRGPAVMAPAGSPVGPFTAVTTDGETVSDDAFSGTSTLVGVFSPGCPACAERMPSFVEAAKNRAGGRASVLAVLAGREEEVAAERAALEPVARVVIETSGGGLTRALSVNGFPAFALVDASRTVVASGTSMDGLGA
ncbi:redoxin family protein [Microbispora sp. RL4-1S]|uniref:Redoxin family protein n=1 Tax=Microbispora oryzae TaxID=2806554 RepID=A0A940WL56_9ACTN|nr:redoxin family protein [Microbispora oryzae]MBP2706973.1 redoxin family protein [Microbispora oryzae]